MPQTQAVAALAPSTAARHDRIGLDGLASILEGRRGIDCLSLDCFDTIVWRLTDQPKDVFTTLQNLPAFRALGFTARMRIASEGRARQLARVARGSNEVTLADIYQAAFPELEAEALAALAEAELSAEMSVCYAPPAAVELLRSARRRGMRVIIVSDSYLRESQLRRLLAAVLPADALEAIGRVVVSCEHGKSKADGLLAIVRDRYLIKPERTLHVGDNPVADIQAARQLGMSTTLLVHLDAELAQRQHGQATALGLLDTSVRHTRALHAPYHGVLSASRIDPADSDALIGYGSLGPVMHAFASWVLAQERELRAQGKKPKLLFLLRDGHLPHQACEALAGHEVGHRVRLSRFAAFAASFRTVADVDGYLASFASSRLFETMVRQLQLPASLGARIVERARVARDDVAEFTRQIRSPQALEAIFAGSGAFRARLRRYLEREVDLQPGDTLVFVDLGYVGTAQRLLRPVFEQEWGVELLGRYLMCTGAPERVPSRAGLIDTSWCEDRAIDALLPFVSLLENLSTTADGSLEDYREDGSPVLGELKVALAQNERVERIQAHCLSFVRDAQAWFDAGPRPVDVAMLRDVALGEFGRLVYLPGALELQHFDAFALDLNLGTDMVKQLYDVDRGLAELRRHGICYTQRDPESLRINTPSELRHAGVELSLAMLTTYRFGLGFERDALTLRREPIAAMATRGAQIACMELSAVATHDGYFSLHVPLGRGDMHVGLSLGERYAWLQVESVRCLRPQDLRIDARDPEARDLRDVLILDGVEDVGGGIWHCLSDAALVMIPAGSTPGFDTAVAEIIFRPLTLASAAPAQ